MAGFRRDGHIYNIRFSPTDDTLVAIYHKYTIRSRDKGWYTVTVIH